MQIVEFTEDDGVAIITLNRPEKLNALNRAMAAELNAAFREFFASSRYRVALYRARGRSFSAGVDVVDFQQVMKDAADGDLRDVGKDFNIDFEDAEFCEKPIIAAIQGQCFGAGFTSSLACDMRLAAENAQFCLPEVKLGVASVHGNLRLVQMAGLARSMELLLTGETRDAQWALDAGVVNEVVPLAQLQERSLTYARTIAAMDPKVVHATRKVGFMSQYSSFADTVAMGLSLRANFRVNSDYVERVTRRAAPAQTTAGI